MSALEGKVAVITGGSSGIGLAIAKRFASEGAYVFITSRRQAELDKAVAEIGSNATAVQGDVSKLEDLDRLYATIAGQNRKLDVVVANAGFVEIAPITTATPEHFDKVFDTNARGAFFTVQKALPLMNDGGSIILVASAGKNKATPGRSTYSGTKAALRAFVRTWTMELKDRHIRSNVLSPGATDTPIIDGLFGSKEAAEVGKKQFVAATPLGRMGRPEEIASAALFLASSESSFVAGIDLLVDGGLSAV
ncbi:MAG: glucose 1-dehydrogenase [Candidatus Obscuribacterales bacterium]|nr:glucose 1-dehydrogenase [Candidatus Obscuribacterales bacterium]